MNRSVEGAPGKTTICGTHIFSSASDSSKNQKLPNEPILDFAPEPLIQGLANICAILFPKNEPIFTRSPARGAPAKSG